ncbi:hypothetical protein CSAL01_08891 [Colletotrichum salicis]|uniref:Uncharacterized protein n=1 Tax=Colletotrichum salicis TaxID=1209931 RepID=A0A135UFP5_9PEZI|nr:hypothetical protein CSAL01_08891 [Colletotrichum salicis]
MTHLETQQGLEHIDHEPCSVRGNLAGDFAAGTISAILISPAITILDRAAVERITTGRPLIRHRSRGGKGSGGGGPTQALQSRDGDVPRQRRRHHLWVVYAPELDIGSYPRLCHVFPTCQGNHYAADRPRAVASRGIADPSDCAGLLREAKQPVVL